MALLRWRTWDPFGAVVAAAVCVAGVGLGDIDHRPSLCVAGVALGDIDRHFAWQASYLWHWSGSGGALGPRLAPWSPRLFEWQEWHLATSTFILRGTMHSRSPPRCAWWRPPPNSLAPPKVKVGRSCLLKYLAPCCF